jgi:hypothetical protein
VDGIYFDVVPQADDPAGPAGFFIMESLDLPEGVTLLGVGSNPIVLLVREGVHVRGTIDVGARQDPASTVAALGHHLPGPGGFSGGGAGEQGLGPCPGGTDGGEACNEYTTAGGGGGGFGGRGGDGGDGAEPPNCNTVYEGGAGGGPCGAPELRPLTGGSGGGGGGRPPTGTSAPGPGGAGGGGLQITSLTFIHVYATGIITAPGGGGGGGDLNAGGGGGGGAGGGVLLEAAEIVLDPGSVIAANGGGGGSGDCT